MEHLQQSFTVPFEYKVYFTSALFDEKNPLLNNCLVNYGTTGSLKKIFFVIDEGVVKSHPALLQQVKQYFHSHPAVQLVNEILVVPGGETVKNSETFFRQVIDGVHIHGIDRHSYIAAIGGGAVLSLTDAY